ncbi:MAG: phosphoenolpyruvate--protein phosphotransferase [Pseudomonadota bacterium]
MSFTMHGVGVSEGITIGHAHLAIHDRLEVAHYLVPAAEVAGECARFDTAVQTVHAELEGYRNAIPSGSPPEFTAFLDLHLMILDDAMLSEAPRRLIETQRCNAEWAVKQQLDALLEQFDAIEDGYLRERKADVIQVGERVLKALLGKPGHIPVPEDLEQASILVAHDLSPADIIQFKQQQFAGFLTDLGGATSHTAIVARSLNIPAIVALHQARHLIRENDLLVVDGTQGVVIVNPDKHVLAEYRLRQDQWEIEQHKLKRLKTARSVTLDGVRVELYANIELPEDIEQVKDNRAAGIGLFRTEFLFLNRDGLPGEEEQFEAYRKVALEMGDLPVTVRTLDVGADKPLLGQERNSTNPALGLRAIRLCLSEPSLFHTQLRAILRASHYGKLRILIPMLSSLHEVEQSLHAIKKVKKDMDEEGIPYDHDIPVGGMIEVPAAALSVHVFARKLDFLSIGTNDLIQYTLAIDRTDDSVAHLYDPLHPAVLHLVSETIKGAQKAGIPISVCGEMAGDVAMTRLLLGLGLRQFSMHPAHLLRVKQQVLKTDLREIAATIRRMLKTDEPQKLRDALVQLNA